jgi:hypothetical protein
LVGCWLASGGYGRTDGWTDAARRRVLSNSGLSPCGFANEMLKFRTDEKPEMIVCIFTDKGTVKLSPTPAQVWE